LEILVRDTESTFYFDGLAIDKDSE
jgi:hypothetical protein